MNRAPRDRTEQRADRRRRGRIGATPDAGAPRRRGIGRPTAIGAVVALMIVAVVIGWSLRGAVETTTPRIADAETIGGPAPLTDEERATAVSGLDSQSMAHLASGAWVEVADPQTGRLAQRYSATRVDPLPDQWVKMEQPRASFHTSGGRIVTLRGDTATARVPRRAIESGRVEGGVVVHMYRAGPDGRVDPSRDAPAVQIFADEADYDSGVGQLRCEGRVEVRTSAARFVGRGLTLLMETGGTGTRRAEELIIDEALEPVTIDLVALRADREAQPAGSDAEPATGPGSTPGRQANDVAPRTGTTPAPSARANGAAPVAPAAVAPPYRLTLHDDVVVRRFRNGVESTVTGDRLALVFALDGDGPGGDLMGAATPRLEPTVTYGPMPIDTTSTLLLMPFAASTSHHAFRADDRADREGMVESDRLEITYTGRLVMVQSTAEEDRLLTPDETIVEVHGAPVRFAEPDAMVQGRCAMLRYRTGNGRLDLIGEPRGGARAGLHIETPEGDLTGQRLWLERDRGVGRIEGAGRMTLRDRAPAAPLAFASAVAFRDASPGAAGSAEAAALSMLAAIGASIGAELSQPPGTESLEILWSDGVDLAFDPGSDDGESGRLREAHFRGDVRVNGDEFAMRSDAMRVGFGAGGELDQSISEIEATGGVNVDRLGTAGTMTCRTLLVTMQTHEGRSIPHVMTATNDVVAQDDAQTIWSERVEVTFRPRPDRPDQPDRVQPAPRQAGDEADASEDRMGGAEVHTVNARGDVRVRMRDGAMVFADHLDGDAIERRIRLTGDDVMLLRDRVVADRMSSVRFDETARTAHADGPGRFRLLVDAPSPPVDAPGGLRRPRLDAARSEVEAQWQRSMAIDEVANAGAGSIDLRGDVHVVTEPDPMRRDTLRADSLVLELRHRDRTPEERRAAAADGPDGASDADGPAPVGTDIDAIAQTRDLARMIARTEADLQSRRWSDAGRTQPPRLFRVRGQHVEHDTVTGESLVVGNGQLLVHDPTPATEAEATGFGRRGTAIFGWKQRMEMRRIVDERFLITMEDNVEVLHEGVAPGDELTLTTDRLEATIDRGPRPIANGPGARGPEDGGQAPPGADPFGLGGDSELRRLRAMGVTFIGTPDYRIDCHEFDYNTISGIARISARPGRVVRALVTRTASPLQAREMVWDLRLGRLQITQGGGGALR